MDWENHLEKKSDPKNRNSKNLSEIAACEKKLASFCSNTVSSLYFKIRVKNFIPQNHHSLFRSTSRFGVTKVTTLI